MLYRTGGTGQTQKYNPRSPIPILPAFIWAEIPHLVIPKIESGRRPIEC